MISTERIEEIARGMVLRNQVLSQITKNEEVMIGETYNELDYRDPKRLALVDHSSTFHGLNYMLAEIAQPFMKIRDLWAPDSKIVLGDRFYFDYDIHGQPQKEPKSWQRSMMFIYKDNGVPDGVIAAHAFANLKKSFRQRQGWNEYRMSFWDYRGWLDETHQFSFRQLSERALQAGVDFSFVTKAEDILHMKGLYPDQEYTFIIPDNAYGSINYGNNVHIIDADIIEENLAEIMSGAAAFRNQIRINL